MNIYNIIVIILISYITYKNKEITKSEIIVSMVIICILSIKYINYKCQQNTIKKNIYNHFNYEIDLNKKIYNRNLEYY
jgi:hypothetical protein